MVWRRSIPTPRCRTAEGFESSWTGEPLVRVFAADGRLTHIVRWRQPAETVTPPEIEAFVADAAEGRRPALLAALTRGEARRDLFSGIWLDGNDRLWVRLVSSPGSRHRYLQFALDGSTSGYVDLPPGVRIWALNQHEVTVTWHEGEEVSVRVYRLPGPPR